ncbi:hypothetical protein ACFSQQ_13675 [Mesorhizobium kowhaii]|uniref:hypothetical protein n=1 Tax=Mesorhizobium kowhaii TaxID=1300272 RepID=UPI0035EC1D08
MIDTFTQKEPISYANDNFFQISGFNRRPSGRSADFRRNAIIFARILVVTIVVLGIEWYQGIEPTVSPSIDFAAQQYQ